MFGIVIPNYTKEKFSDIVSMNNDKNYITPAEIAALADNKLLNVNASTVAELLTRANIPINGPDAVDVINQAVAIAQFAREL